MKKANWTLENFELTEDQTVPARMSMDGNMWCAIDGWMPTERAVGFGKTQQEAVDAFNQCLNRGVK